MVDRRGFYFEYLAPLYFFKSGVIGTLIEGDKVPEADQKEFWQICTGFLYTAGGAGVITIEVKDPDKPNIFERVAFHNNRDWLSFRTSGMYGIMLGPKMYIQGTSNQSGAMQLEYVGHRLLLVDNIRVSSLDIRRGFWKFLK